MPDEQEIPYNPLAISSIAESVVHELFSRPCHQLDSLARFTGAGVYAIYYHGDFAEYESVARQNQLACVAPIYVGKAIPRGGRKGANINVNELSTPLYHRLMQHAESLGAATNLRIADFRCRYLVVEELFIEIAERRLIQQFKPVWNVCVDGFGNHDPGKGRYGGRRPGWDEVHPGRVWAAKMPAKPIERARMASRDRGVFGACRSGIVARSRSC